MWSAWDSPVTKKIFKNIYFATAAASGTLSSSISLCMCLWGGGVGVLNSIEFKRQEDEPSDRSQVIDGLSCLCEAQGSIPNIHTWSHNIIYVLNVYIC